MKKLLFLLMAVATFAITGCADFEDEINRVDEKVNNLEQRVTALEELCRTMNTNIESLQTIVAALQKNDYVTDVVPVMTNNEVIGYTISFTNSNPITIYHGTDGKDGADGKDGTDGKDGHSPIVGVKADVDGIFYWTLDGAWILDQNGNKIKAVGLDGKDGANGENGKDGADGKDGENGADGKDGIDGITPQLKIENDYWYISYDNGASWTQLYRATGEDGADGKDGDSFFSSVEQDEDNLYLTLADGTELTLPLVSNYLFNRLQSVCYVPRFDDGKAPAYYLASGAISASYVEMDFEVSPKDAVEDIVVAWKSILSMQAVNTITRAVSFVDLTITSCVGDVENGVITVRAAAENLGEEFFEGNTTFSARIGISDGNTDIKSAYVPLIATEITQPNNEIWYTATEQLVNFAYSDFGDATIVSHTFDEETGAGILTFDKDLTKLGRFRYGGMSDLLTISLPNGIEELGETCFNHGTLVSVKLGKGLKIIGNGAFQSCKKLPNLEIPNGVTTIGNSAFSNCSSLESISIPESVTAMGEYVFNWCKALKSLTIPSSVKRIEQCVAYNCLSLTEVVISEGVEYIGVQAFAGCNLRTLTIPSTVTGIGNMCFYKNCNLATVYCKPTTAPVIGGAIFDATLIWLPENGADRCGVIYVPASAYNSYVAEDTWNTYAVYAPVYQDTQILQPYNFTE